jgi:3-dehydro-L-gulonate 2-dehydrogenase
MLSRCFVLSAGCTVRRLRGLSEQTLIQLNIFPYFPFSILRVDMIENQTKQPPQRVRISAGQMEERFFHLLVQAGLSDAKARTCARVFTENSIDGVYTHGVNRFPRFLQYIKDKLIMTEAEPLLKSHFGAVEQWDGQSGPGILNAIFCTERAMNLARENGIGCVAIANTNHWMRGGTYGWKAAKEGFAFICFTNTIANMPAWGAKESRLGNNPLIIAIPYRDEAIIVDMAMSQFSFGKVDQANLQGEELPVPGGFNDKGELSKDPATIIKSSLLLPIGYWKGSALSLLLDILAAILSGGLATNEISKLAAEINVSQVFIAIDLSKMHNTTAIGGILQAIVEDYKSGAAIEGGFAVRFPGEAVVKTRKENLEKGIPVNEKVWAEIMSL